MVPTGLEEDSGRLARSFIITIEDGFGIRTIKVLERFDSVANGLCKTNKKKKDLIQRSIIKNIKKMSQ